MSFPNFDFVTSLRNNSLNSFQGINTVINTTSKYVDKAIDKTSEIDRNIYRTVSDTEYGVFENVNEAKSTLPGSLFYEAQTSEDGRSGLFNYYVIGDARSAEGGGKFTYIKSETYQMNRMVTPEVSRNPTAHNIIEKTTANSAYLDPKSRYVSQPYNVKDFIFCKHYGIIPNNRMITLRRFPHPIMDNLRVPTPGPRPELVSKDGKTSVQEVSSQGITRGDMERVGVGLPVAQAVTFFGEGTGNNLSEILKIDSGLNWKDNTQATLLNAQGNDRGFLDSSIGKYLQGVAGDDVMKNAQGISNAIGTFTDPENVEQRIKRTFFDKLTSGDGPLSKKIFVDVNTVNQMYTRAVGFEGGKSPITLTFTYSLTSVGTVNSRMLFIDLLANLLTIGTDYGKFLTPQLLVNSNKQGIGFPLGSAGYVKSLLQPVEFLNDMLDINWSSMMQAKKQTLEDRVTKAKSELEGLKKGTKLPKDGVVYKTLTALLSDQLLTQLKYEPIMLSGYPTGEWHMVVGNPLNPIAMIGNLICSGVNIKLNSVLGPDDFPTEMTATYTLKPARQKHRGDFESMFNRGNGRLYLGKVNYSDESKNANITAQSKQDITQVDLSDAKNGGSLANPFDY